MKSVVPLVFLLFISLASASYITIVTTVHSDIIYGNSTTILIKLEQRGDESAYDVEVVPLVPNDFVVEGFLKKERLDPGKTLYGSFNLSLKKNMPHGKYPLVIRTVYHDANRYPFSVVSPHSIVHVSGYESGISGSIDELELAKEGSGENVLKIRNLDDTPKEISVRLYLPKELKADENEKTVSIGPREEKRILFSVESVGALPGSSYSILASLEYDSGYHYTSFANGPVRIVERKESFDIITVLAALFIILLVIFIYLKWCVKGGEKK